MKDLTSKILAEFDEQFVKKDMGPDGDGYDANLPRWNDDFNRLRNPESEWEKEFDQIEAIKSFISLALQRQLDEIRGKVGAEIENLKRAYEGAKSRGSSQAMSAYVAKMAALSDLIKNLTI